MIIKFQTSALIPAPYAYAIQLDLKANADKTLGYDLDLEYLDRNELTEDEILDEGFTLSDDIQLSGSLPITWLEEFKLLDSKTEKTEKTELEENEDFWLLETNSDAFYPKNTNQWATFLEQIRQAILENSGFEKPLEITIVEITNKNKKTTTISGSFEKRTLKVQSGDIKKSLKWSQLTYILRDLYSGDFNYEAASTKAKNADGLYLNFGDEYWFELGKSYINKPSKVKAWISS